MDTNVKGLNADLQSYNRRLAVGVFFSVAFLATAIVIGIIALNDHLTVVSLRRELWMNPWKPFGETIDKIHEVSTHGWTFMGISIGLSSLAIAAIIFSVHSLIKKRETQAKLDAIPKKPSDL